MACELHLNDRGFACCPRRGEACYGRWQASPGGPTIRLMRTGCGQGPGSLGRLNSMPKCHREISADPAPNARSQTPSPRAHPTEAAVQSSEANGATEQSGGRPRPAASRASPGKEGTSASHQSSGSHGYRHAPLPAPPSPSSPVPSTSCNESSCAPHSLALITHLTLGLI